MSNNIIQAVLFTIRDIENKEYFKGVAPDSSQTLISYFLSCNDDLTKWLKEHAQEREVIKTNDEPSIDKYKSLSGDIRENADEFENSYGRVYNDDHSLSESISEAKDLGELQAIKASFLSAYEDVSEAERCKWGKIYSFISEIPDAESSEIEYQQESNGFSLEAYNKLKFNILDSNITHCDKERPLVQHRLGWYHKEDDETAVCAAYPWSGEMEKDHNKRWAIALISTMMEQYNSLKKIILVCHDKDFSGFSGKDEVVTGGLFDNLKISCKKLDCLIVFQHSNSTINGALNKNKASEVYSTIKEYAEGFLSIKKADEDNKNATAHDDFLKDKTTEEGGK